MVSSVSCISNPFLSAEPSPTKRFREHPLYDRNVLPLIAAFCSTEAGSKDRNAVSGLLGMFLSKPQDKQEFFHRMIQAGCELDSTILKHASQKIQSAATRSINLTAIARSDFPAIFARFPEISTVRARDLNDISYLVNSVKEIGILPKVQHLDVSRLKFTFFYFPVFFPSNSNAMPNLESLNLSDNKALIRDQDIEFIQKNIPKLKILNIKNCTRITRGALAPLRARGVVVITNNPKLFLKTNC